MDKSTYQQNRERILLKQKEWRERNIESERERHKKNYHANKEYYRQKQKQWRKNNPEHLKELKRNSYLRNREKALATVKAYRERNLNKILESARQRYKDNPDLFKERSLKYKYGMTYQDKEKIYLSQECKCKICKASFQIQELHIDHNHETNVVRGLLCPNCNTSLGLLSENIQTLVNMIKYIKTGGNL